eukprot:m.213080 g.213080  ORF g.213080 m.213080 type:complete len:284 (+) comp26364_c0_seq1:116-967(+)
MADRFSVRGEAADSVAEYIKYRHIVGNADGGRLLTDAEYTAFKRERGIVDDGPVRAVGPPPQPSEEEVMAIYEQRYQARRKAERSRLRPGEAPPQRYAIALNMPPMHLMDALAADEAAGMDPAPRMPWDEVDPTESRALSHRHGRPRGQAHPVPSTTTSRSSRLPLAQSEPAGRRSHRGQTQSRRGKDAGDDDAESRPREPARLSVGDRVVVVSKRGTVTEPGCLRFLGPTAFGAHDEVWAGVELDDDTGRNDGSMQGQRYFTCNLNHGLFVKPDRIRRESRN